MQTFERIADFRAERIKHSGSVGFVPTMGYLHDGHLSLVKAASEENDLVIVSIFVNPMQFDNSDDFALYPRDSERDLSLLEENGVHLVLLPTPQTMYPEGFQTYVTVEGITQGLEGAYRQGHFRGVTTVVNKLFNIVQPTRAYFGQKDAQQVAVIRQMVHDLAIPLEIRAMPTLREKDGLAMSSRNARLSESERQQATILYRALSAAKEAHHQGEKNPKILRDIMRETLESVSDIRIDYASVADANTLQELEQASNATLLLSIAAYIGDVRLIDNMVV